jgi:hypothetical protein
MRFAPRKAQEEHGTVKIGKSCLTLAIFVARMALTTKIENVLKGSSRGFFLLKRTGIRWEPGSTAASNSPQNCQAERLAGTVGLVGSAR